LGLALVAGKNRVPKPATGKTAFVTLRIVLIPCKNSTHKMKQSLP
jgi:hypothetical protein